jgi:hydroxymethylbilane synthase
MELIIGSRGSDLALWQANFVKASLEQLGHSVTIKIILTKGDKIQNLSFDKLEGKGFFTKEIEEALVNGEIDIAVHSHKDLETVSPEGLMIGAVSYRENPTDQLLIRASALAPDKLMQLKENALVGTSSSRRKTQLIRMRDDLVLKDLRGNVPTRVNKLLNGDYDAIVLASAGLARLKLDLSELICIELDPTQFVPAPAQGVLAIQIRENDEKLAEVLKAIHHEDVAEVIKIERDILRLFAGGCQLPLGVYVEKEEGIWKINVSYAPSVDEAATVCYYEVENTEDIAEIIVEDLRRGED